MTQRRVLTSSTDIYQGHINIPPRVVMGTLGNNSFWSKLGVFCFAPRIPFDNLAVVGHGVVDRQPYLKFVCFASLAFTLLETSFALLRSREFLTQRHSISSLECLFKTYSCSIASTSSVHLNGAVV